MASWRRSRQQGQAMVELALLSVVLVLIMMGVLDFARLYQTNTALQEAAREAARHAAWYDGETDTNPFLSNAQIRPVIATVMNGAGLAQTVVMKSASQCPANDGPAPPDTTQIWVYTCLPTSAAACSGAPAGSGQDVDVGVVLKFGLIVQSSLLFGPDFPMRGDAHMRVQGC